MLREVIAEHLLSDVLQYIRDLEIQNTRLNGKYTQLENRYDRLVDEYRLLPYKRFGRSSEKIVVTQGLLFDEDTGPSLCRNKR